MKSACSVVSAYIHTLEHRAAGIGYLRRRSIILLIERYLEVRRSTETYRAGFRLKVIAGEQELLILRNTGIGLADIDGSRVSGDVRRDIDIVREDACVLEQPCCSACYEVTAHSIGMRFVTRAEEQAQALRLAIG